ncbi:MAG TPA: Fe-Mn family superoxide dismutase [Roseiflexaceae bacterium]
MSSARLHELYFGSLGGDGAVLFTGSGDGTGLPKPVAAALEQQFGGPAAWQREFIALARALGGRSGWVVLSYGRDNGRLYNQIVGDGSPLVIDTAPLLVLDMYEHAYHQEFGANTSAYVDAFMRNVDWPAVAQRLTQAAGRTDPLRNNGDTVPSITVEELMARCARAEPL